MKRSVFVVLVMAAACLAADLPSAIGLWWAGMTLPDSIVIQAPDPASALPGRVTIIWASRDVLKLVVTAEVSADQWPAGVASAVIPAQNIVLAPMTQPAVQTPP